MPKNKVNNNIKLKSGGGILNGADGLSVDTTVYPTTPTMLAYEDLVAGDLLKPYNDAGTPKIRKIHGVKATLQTTTTVANVSQIEYCSILRLSDTLSIANAQYNSTSYCFAVNITQAGVLTNGAVVNLNSGAGVFTMRSAPKLYRVSNTSFLAVWQGLQADGNTIYCRVCTVSGTTITMGAITTLVTGSTGTDSYEHNSCSAVEMATNTFLITFNLIGYTSNYLMGTIITISGTTISTNTIYTISSTLNSSTTNCEVIKIDTNKAVVVSNYHPSSLRAVIITVSGTTLSASGEANIVTAEIANISNSWYYAFTLRQINTNQFVVAYCTGTNVVTLATFSVSGTTFTQAATHNITVTHGNALPSLAVISASEVYVAINTRCQQYLIDSSLGIATAKYYDYSGAGPNKTRQLIDGNFNGACIFVEGTKWSGGNYAFVLRRFIYDHARFITSANASYNAGDTVPLTNVFTGFSGLTVGQDYYVRSDGLGLGRNTSYQKIGTAINATTILKG